MKLAKVFITLKFVFILVESAGVLNMQVTKIKLKFSICFLGASFHSTQPLRISLLQLQVEGNKAKIVFLHFNFEAISKESASKCGNVRDACACMQV